MAGGLQALHQFSGAGEQHVVAVLDQGAAEGGGDVGFARARRTEQQQVGALVQPGIAGGQGRDARSAQHGHMGEIEAVERLVRRQARFGQVALDAPLHPFSHLQLGKSGEEACGGPALAVGPLGHLGPQAADGGQAQLAQQQRQPGDVHLDAAHGCASTAWSAASSAS